MSKEVMKNKRGCILNVEYLVGMWLEACRRWWQGFSLPLAEVWVGAKSLSGVERSALFSSVVLLFPGVLGVSFEHGV